MLHNIQVSYNAEKNEVLINFVSAAMFDLISFTRYTSLMNVISARQKSKPWHLWFRRRVTTAIVNTWFIHVLGHFWFDPIEKSKVDFLLRFFLVYIECIRLNWKRSIPRLIIVIDVHSTLITRRITILFEFSVTREQKLWEWLICLDINGIVKM